MFIKDIRIPDKNTEFDVAHFRATVDAAYFMIRSLLLLNGGSIIAIITFLGSAASAPSEPGFGQLQLAEAVRFFLIGAGLALFGAILAYITMLFQRGVLKKWVSRMMFSVCWILWMLVIIGSFIGFALGSLTVISGLSE